MRLAASWPRKTNNSAGQRRKAGGLPPRDAVCADKSAWKFVPPNPKALTAARACSSNQTRGVS
jgi:hypothetical protein